MSDQQHLRRTDEPACPYDEDCSGDGLTCHHPAEFTITADAGPGLFYMGTDGTLYRLDEHWPHDGEWCLSGGERETAVCMALLRFSLAELERGGNP